MTRTFPKGQQLALPFPPIVLFESQGAGYDNLCRNSR